MKWKVNSDSSFFTAKGVPEENVKKEREQRTQV